MACLFILEPTFFVLNPDGLESFSPWTQKFFNSVSYDCVRIMKQKKVGPREGRGGGGGIKGFTVISLPTKSPPRSLLATNANNSEITETV